MLGVEGSSPLACGVSPGAGAKFGASWEIASFWMEALGFHAQKVKPSESQSWSDAGWGCWCHSPTHVMHDLRGAGGSEKNI